MINDDRTGDLLGQWVPAGALCPCATMLSQLLLVLLPTESFFPTKKKKPNNFGGTLDEATALRQTAWTDGAERSVWPITLLVV